MQDETALYGAKMMQPGMTVSQFYVGIDAG